MRNQPQTGAPTRLKTPTPSTPPYNPGLHSLVEGKQAWAVYLDEKARANGFLGWHQRGYLPHYDAPGVTQFVTFRLVDSLPAVRRGEWQHLLRFENNRERRRKLEACLDRGWGECWLRQPAIADIAERGLRFCDGQKYALVAWVVMPNHVHVLVDIWDTPLTTLIKGWKSKVVGDANRLIGRRGAFWEREYMDTVIKDEDYRRKAMRYIESNPVKAGLVKESRLWLWSSARFRDERGQLKCSDRENRI